MKNSNTVPHLVFCDSGWAHRGWHIVGDLRPAGMCPGQCSSEGDAGAGDLCTGRVRMRERRGDGDCGAAESLTEDDNRGLRVRATVDGDGLAVAKANRVWRQG